MPNISQSQRKDKGSTSSGHGALGMGGQPDDNPRDQAGGHENLPRDDRPAPVPGAEGAGKQEGTGDKSPDEVVGARASGGKTADELVDQSKKGEEKRR